MTDVAAELKRNFDFDQSQIYSIDSSDVTPENLDNLRNHILSQNATGDYTGYVVVHGTDTMEYAGSYLSLALSKLQKPVVLT